MKQTLMQFGLVAALALAGCQATPQAEQVAWPKGVPSQARLVGGGLVEDLQFPVDGLLYVVDSQSNIAATTIRVEANQKINTSMQEIVGSLLLARHGAEGLAIFAIMQNANPEDAVSSLPTEPLTTELYFASLESLGLTSTDALEQAKSK